jgi:signal peptidase I
VATVLSASMRPTMPEGSVVLITPMAARDVRVGDVVTYQIPVEDRRVVTHRVVEILEGGEHPVIRTQGDANNAPDPWIARMASGPLWKVRGAVPAVGSAVNALRLPVAQRVCVLVLPLVMSMIWLGEIWLPRRARA